ncbi:EAL domain-containing protein [Pseudomonas trivialis]|uniref:EAL domain-containing response regulator n=1 Tax=Pseudomonas trivialis TaxID=200450 RepID=UPI000A4A7320|nr:EAL domain-containing response regulator [Pseudomonas trivialis]
MSHLKILVIEEYPFERAVIVKILNHLGYNSVIHVSSASEGLSFLQQNGAVDLAICNLEFNRTSELDTLALLRLASEHHLIRSVVISETIPADLNYFIQELISTMEVEFLGDLGRPFDVRFLDRLLRRKTQKNVIQKKEVVASKKTPTKCEILSAIAHDEIKAYYQPKVDLVTGEVVGAEVLARWEVKGRIIQPSEFLPAVETHKLMDVLFYELLEQGLKLLSSLKKEGHTLSLAYNLHCTQLVESKLTKNINSSLHRHNISASQLTFEITENGFIENSPLPLENLIRLRVMGCGLSIDDFGVGFSSLERLCQLPFSEIKIDAGFVQSIGARPSCKAAIENTIALASSLNMQVVAEGIETIEQRHALLQMGCNLGQGYLYSPPVSWQEMHSWAVVGRKRGPLQEVNWKPLR